MDFDVGDLFGNLFGGAAAAVAAMIVQPEAAGLPTPAVEPEAAEVEEVPDFDSLPLPGDPCPVCGSLEEWTDLLGRQRCGVCKRATLDKAIQWADGRHGCGNRPNHGTRPRGLRRLVFLAAWSIHWTSAAIGPCRAKHGACAGCECGQEAMADSGETWQLTMGY